MKGCHCLLCRFKLNLLIMLSRVSAALRAILLTIVIKVQYRLKRVSAMINTSQKNSSTKTGTEN